MTHSQPTATLIIIGNEILSGRTQDTNLNYLAKILHEIGIYFAEVRVIPDVESTIIETVNHLRKTHDYVFTTGGIGPTHDDITSLSVAKAFGVELIQHEEALARLKTYYQDSPKKLNDARLKMADIPEGATLIDNPISAAPGFCIENVYVLAGVPVIMQAMLDYILPTLKGSAPLISKTIATHLTEGDIAAALGQVQDTIKNVEIGSYPFMKDGKLGVSVVIRSANSEDIDLAAEKIRSLILNANGNIIEE